ncbi:glycosyltransferase family 4 protein [Ureibacillus thermosphaericus]|uniref:glycosyltransferase family 4 protein n=1 Tax=Ureibacillus thermosphaericus TaxID=51173 RepID=UPI00030F9ED2|nr:glycosyltransferase family 4 protein [Ureibacillus thermosphaericus]
MSKIWIFNQYNMPPEYGHLNRHYNLGKYLKKLGHEPTVFVGSYLHNTPYQMINDETLIKKYENCDFSYYFIKTCNYGNSKIKRVYAMYEYYKNLLKVTKSFEKPDVIIGSSAHPLAAIAAIKLGKKYGCQSIVEIRDLWPESFTEYGIMSKKNPILRLLYKGEKWIYEKADKIIFTMEGGKDYIIEKGWDKDNGGPINLNKIYHINNGVDLEVFSFNKEQYHFKDEDLDNPDYFKVVYAGSIRLVNNVKSIVDAAKEIKNMGEKNIRFIIFGEGSDKSSLEEYCQKNKIDNVVFKGFVDKKYIPNILSKSDLNIIHFQQNNIKKYGASLNKMFEYFASGKPTISDCQFGYDIIKKFNCGFVINNASAKQLAEKIIFISKMPKDEYQKYCVNSLIAAKEYDFKNLANKLIKLI